MLISELIEQLIDIQADHPDAEVRLAIQPQWAFEYSIPRVVAVTTEPEDTPSGSEETIVYISEGGQITYLPGDAQDQVW